MGNKRGNGQNNGNWLLRRVVLCILYLTIIGTGFGGYHLLGTVARLSPVFL
jgi:hypothetical protein